MEVLQHRDKFLKLLERNISFRKKKFHLYAYGDILLLKPYVSNRKYRHLRIIEKFYEC